MSFCDEAVLFPCVGARACSSGKPALGFLSPAGGRARAAWITIEDPDPAGHARALNRYLLGGTGAVKDMITGIRCG